MTYASGDVFSGDFLNGRRYIGQMTYKNSGDIYNGEFNDLGLMNGNGKLTYSNGDVYSGEF